MTAGWTAQQLEQVDVAREVEIEAQRPDGSWTRWTPIWGVRVGEGVYVRTWYLRSTGWFGAALATGRARVRFAEFQAEVGVEAVDAGVLSPNAEVSDAYRMKYGPGASDSMVTTDAERTTLRLRPADPHSAAGGAALA